MTVNKKKLWTEALKWPLYSVAIMPIILSAAFNLYLFKKINIGNFFAFGFASILILFWENLTNDLFDAETGIDEFKFESVVNIFENKKILNLIAYSSLLIGLIVISIISFSTNINILFLIIGCCTLGYIYQGPPFRLGYFGLGEPLCWIAFGPLAHSAALLALDPNTNNLSNIPFYESLLLGSGPALATTLILFCSHFHQITQDRKHGKKSPLVLIGTKKGAFLIPLIILVIYLIELIIIFFGFIPYFCLIFLISFPYAFKLIQLLKHSHNKPSAIKNCKFIAVKFQTLNGIGLILGLIISFLN